MTSSSNNSYDAVDYYVEVFNQAGADAEWLPVDRAYQDARTLERCDLLDALHSGYASDAHVSLLFPDYAAKHLAACEDPQSVLDMIASADALFINGGGQRRSLDALMPLVNGERSDSNEMALIRERFEKGELLVGGTSAGTAVQGGGYLNDAANVNPMIDGGQSYDVTQSGFDEGIVVFEGGLGLFNFGITDTHFSERARESRLVKLSEQTDVRFGFGVDETTALFVDKKENEEGAYAIMRVLGKGGVFISDIGESTINSAANETLDIENVRVHYVIEGDTVYLNAEEETLRVQLSGDEVSENSDVANVENDDVMYQDNYRTMAHEMISSGAASARGTSYEDSPTMTIELSRDDRSVGAVQGDRSSHTNVLMSISAVAE
jgi:cyanophycinase